MLTLVALLGIVALVTATKQDRLSNDNEVVSEVVTQSTESPEERLPDDVGFNWKGRSTDPKRIQIPAIGVDAFMQSVGVDQNSQIAVPNNIHVAGWFVDSVRPGDQGLSIIDGHINGRYTDEGIFKRLNELKVDDTVRVVFGDDSVREFRVYSAASHSLTDAPSVLYSQVPEIKNQLNLITCIGSYDVANRTYDSRHIVILEAV